MFGYQEILIISAIIVGVLVVPRMVKPPPKPPPRIVRSKNQLSGAGRVAIAASIIYPLIVAAVIQPWRGDMIRFAYAGLGPVLLGWLLHWVFRGFKRG